jgi:hypothetical protein
MSYSNIPITLYLIGFAGAGKYTIANQFADSGYKVVDNQLINKPIFSLLDQGGAPPIPENAWEAIGLIRTAVLNFISQDKKSDFVLTKKLCGVEQDMLIYNQVRSIAEARGSLFIPVRLAISPEERKRRITNPERASRLKTTKFSEQGIEKNFLKIDHPNLMEIDVTNLNPKQVKDAISNFIESLINASN